MSKDISIEYAELKKYLRNNGTDVIIRVLNVVDQLTSFNIFSPTDFSAFKDYVFEPTGLEPEAILYCAVVNIRFKTDISKELFACRFTYPLLYEALCVTGTYANGYYVDPNREF